MKTEFDHFNFRLKFSWNLWNIVSRRIKKLCDFWTCPRKIEIKVQPIDLLSWIKFRGPELNQGSSLQNFSFPSLPSCSEPRDHKVSLKPHSKAIRKDPDPKKNSEGLIWRPWPVCRISGSYLDGKYLKQRDHKTPQGPNLRMPALYEGH